MINDWMTLGFAGGVMSFIAFIDIFSKSLTSFEEAGLEEGFGFLYACLSFFFGIIFMFGTGRIISYYQGADTDYDVERMKEEGEAAKLMTPEERKSLSKTGVFAAVAIGLHNFPEGMITFLAYVADPVLGVALAIGIATHNLPEGFCVSLPLYFATGKKYLGMFWSTVSAIAEPIGAGLAWILIDNFTDGVPIGIAFGAVGGIMTHISIIELIPAAFRNDPEKKVTPYAIFAGMVFMSISLILFGF